MKTTTATNTSNSNEEPPPPQPPAKSTNSKTTKKSTKSRSKTTKPEQSSSSGNKSSNSSSSASVANSNSNANSSSTKNTSSGGSANAYPSTPKSTMLHTPDGATTGNGNYNAEGSGSSSSRSHQKNYAGFDARSMKVIWEQHDQSDVELSTEVCARLAEDASYKLWEMINTVKTYARHSGGVVTYELVNEVLRDADVSPSLGAMESDWERIDYDGSYFFYSDKIIELRDEYQKHVTLTLPAGPDYSCAWPVEDKNMEFVKKYIPSITYVSLYGNGEALEVAHNEAAFSPIMGSCYRVLLAKIIQILAFKQNDSISLRCWKLLRALAFNPYVRDVACRSEFFHLAEILICQLLAPYETIKVHGIKKEKPLEQQQQQQVSEVQVTGTLDQQPQPIKMEVDDAKDELAEHEVKNEFTDEEMFNTNAGEVLEEKIYRLQPDDDDDDDDDVDDVADIDNDDVVMADTDMAQKTSNVHSDARHSAYFACAVDAQHVDELCRTIGQMAAVSGYLHSECLHLVLRRLERFFEGRDISTEREYHYISRAVRGLISLGDYAFREFIQYAYKFEAHNVPEHYWSDFAMAAMFLKGADDIFLYEWLQFLCGGDKLQPFLVHYAQYHEQLLTYRFVHRRQGTYKIVSNVGVRRLEWSTVAAAMCHGDDPNKALKPKPAINDYFPELTTPNLQLNRAGNIRFKFAGCRPVIIKPKLLAGKQQQTPQQQQQPKQVAGKTENTTTTSSSGNKTTTLTVTKDIIIARRKLLKPLTNERRILPLSSFYFLRI